MTLADDSAIAAAATTGESLAQGLNRLPRVGLDGVGNTDESGQLSFEAHKDDGRGAAPAMKAIEFNLPNLPNLPGKQPQ